jgi:hypothetical protein
MQLSLLLIVIGIVLAVLVNYALGIVCIPRPAHSLALKIAISEGWQSG